MLSKILKRIKYGYEIDENMFITGGSKDEWVIMYDMRKFKIDCERLSGSHRVIYLRKDNKWLPPHENEKVPDEIYDKIVNALVRHLKKLGEEVECE